jgi:hypothetical protein
MTLPEVKALMLLVEVSAIQADLLQTPPAMVFDKVIFPFYLAD